VQLPRAKYQVSERWACRQLGQCRDTQPYTPIWRVDEETLTAAIVALGSHYGRSGYRRVTALLNQAGFKVGNDRVQRTPAAGGAEKSHTSSVQAAGFGSTTDRA
jgi:hypothetical protein